MYTDSEREEIMNKLENDIANRILTRLADEKDLHAHFREINVPQDLGIDGEIEFLINNKKLHFFVEIKRELKPYHLPALQQQAIKNAPFLLIAERIYPAQRHELKKMGVNYLDAATNIYLERDGVTIWIDGNKMPENEKPITNRAFTKTGLKVVYLFLLNNEILNLPYRDIAGLADVALGNIKHVIDGLTEADFILPVNKSRKVLKNKKALLDRWMAGYGETLKPLLHLGDFDFADKNKMNDWEKNDPKDVPFVWGGEAAGEKMTNYLNAEILTIYTPDPGPLMTHWRLIPRKGGRVRMYKKFWNDEQWDTQQMTPPLLTYADLMINGDPRCVETAEMIFEQYLKNEFEQ